MRARLELVGFVISDGVKWSSGIHALMIGEIPGHH